MAWPERQQSSAVDLLTEIIERYQQRINELVVLRERIVADCLDAERRDTDILVSVLSTIDAARADREGVR